MSPVRTAPARTALVVDDEEQLLRLTARVLEREGYRVLAASTADEARALFAAEREVIETILLDVQMPGGEGAATLMPAMLEARPDLRVVLMSGDALPDSLLASLEHAGGAFIRKPFVPKALIRLLASEVDSGVDSSADGPGVDSATPHSGGT